MAKKKQKFFREFVKEKKAVGAVAPSSRFLCKKMVKPIDFSSAKLIVEFGPGTGVVTREILNKLSSDAHLIIFETNKSFADSLKKNIDDERVTIIESSAEDVLMKLNELGFETGTVDAIVSSLPLAVIPKEIVNAIIINSTKALKKNGLYLQFQYSLKTFRYLKSIFKRVKVDFTAINVPPAFIYICNN